MIYTIIIVGCTILAVLLVVKLPDDPWG